MNAAGHSNKHVQQIASVRIMAIVLLLTTATCLGAIHVLEPNGGEVYLDGAPMLIRWSGGLGGLSISLSRDGGASWMELGRYYDTGSGLFHWASVTGPACTTCRIGVSSLFFPTEGDTR